jgi:hypothetical protein
VNELIPFGLEDVFSRALNETEREAKYAFFQKIVFYEINISFCPIPTPDK